MNFFTIFKINLIRLLKNKKNIIASFVVPVIIILLFGYIFTKISGSENVNAIIISDKGIYGQEFIEEIKKISNIKIYEKNDGIEKVKEKKLPICYEIPENFTAMVDNGQKPQIIAYKRENETETGDFDFNINLIINKIMIKSEFKKNNYDVSYDSLSYKESNIKVSGQDRKNMGDVVILNMLISFALYSSIGISTEICQLKKQNILKRSFTTSNKTEKIIGGLLLALFVLSVVAYNGAFLLNSLIYSSTNLEKAPIIMLNITFLVLVSLSLGIFITRIIKDDNLVPIILQIVIPLTCFVGGSFMPIEFLPTKVTMFSKFTPQYWAIQSINTGNIKLSFIVLLFSIALFTAGTFKAKSFI